MTTTKNAACRVGARATRYTTLCLLALVAVLCHSHEARAQWTTSGTNTTTTGSVGVGTTAPATSLHVSTAAAGTRGIIDEQTSADSNSALIMFRKSRAGAAAQNGDNVGSLFASPFDGANFLNSARVRFAIDGPVTAGSTPTNIQFLTGANADGVERMRITSAGNVGIGTAEPSDRLEINGNVANGAGLTISTSGNAKYRVGTVGTTVPNWGGQIMNARFNQTTGNWTQDDATLNSAFIKLDLRNFSYGNEIGFYRMPAAPSNPRPDTAWSPVAQFKLDTGNVLLTPSSGNVGVGTTAPATKLHVVGDVTVTGNINAKWQDVAEWVPSTQKLAVGTVVVVDAAGQNRVLASAKSYDTGVAGVITGQPGLILGEGGEGKLMVATTGRVKVKVDATRSPVRAGDLLVTSDVAGVAMKSVPVELGGVTFHRPGTIIGKALEPLEKGTGEILVLLSLQ